MSGKLVSSRYWRVGSYWRIACQREFSEQQKEVDIIFMRGKNLDAIQKRTEVMDGTEEFVSIQNWQQQMQQKMGT